jgi:hypothetical protein
MTPRRSNQSRACRCSTIRGFDIREYQFPAGAMATFELYHPLDGVWEKIFRCSACGTFWFQSVTGGHATVEIYNRIDAKEAAAHIAREEAAAPERARAAEQRIAEALADLAVSATSDASPLTKAAERIAGILLGCGILGAFIAMTQQEGPRQMQIVMVAGALIVLGIGAAGGAALLRGRPHTHRR